MREVPGCNPDMHLFPIYFSYIAPFYPFVTPMHKEIRVLLMGIENKNCKYNTLKRYLLIMKMTDSDINLHAAKNCIL